MTNLRRFRKTRNGLIGVATAACAFFNLTGVAMAGAPLVQLGAD